MRCSDFHSWFWVLHILTTTSTRPDSCGSTGKVPGLGAKNHSPGRGQSELSCPTGRTAFSQQRWHTSACAIVPSACLCPYKASSGLLACPTVLDGSSLSYDGPKVLQVRIGRRTPQNQHLQLPVSRKPRCDPKGAASQKLGRGISLCSLVGSNPERSLICFVVFRAIGLGSADFNTP